MCGGGVSSPPPARPPRAGSGSGSRDSGTREATLFVRAWNVQRGIIRPVSYRIRSEEWGLGGLEGGAREGIIINDRTTQSLSVPF